MHQYNASVSVLKTSLPRSQAIDKGGNEVPGAIPEGFPFAGMPS